MMVSPETRHMVNHETGTMGIQTSQCFGTISLYSPFGDLDWHRASHSYLLPHTFFILI